MDKWPSPQVRCNRNLDYVQLRAECNDSEVSSEQNLEHRNEISSKQMLGKIGQEGHSVIMHSPSLADENCTVGMTERQAERIEFDFHT